jgi:GTPase SAR1 family protein
MIVEVLVMSNYYGIELRLEYLPQTVDWDTIRQVGKETRAMEPVADYGAAKVYYLERMGSDGFLRRFGVARRGTPVIMVIGDESEEPESVTDKALSVSEELFSMTDLKPLTSLAANRKKLLARRINDQVIDYVRLVMFGESKSGKSCLFSMLTSGNVPVEYRPSVRAVAAPNAGQLQDILEKKRPCDEDEWYMVANRLLTLYDLPGSTHYRNLWNSYLKRADAAILVLKSNKTGVAQAKRILQTQLRYLPERVIAIGNYQDLEDALPPLTIERFLGVTTYGMVGIDMDRLEQLRDIVRTVSVYEFSGSDKTFADY